MRFLNHRRGGGGWGRKDCRDSTVPRDPTGRAYCTEVAVGLDWGGGHGTQRRTEDTSALEVPLVLTVQFTRRPQWGDSGHWREQDGVQDGSHKYYLQIFFERVSCSPSWPPTGYIGKDDLELPLSPPPKGWTTVLSPHLVSECGVEPRAHAAR